MYLLTWLFVVPSVAYSVARLWYDRDSTGMWSLLLDVYLKNITTDWNWKNTCISSSCADSYWWSIYVSISPIWLYNIFTYVVLYVHPPTFTPSQSIAFVSFECILFNSIAWLLVALEQCNIQCNYVNNDSVTRKALQLPVRASTAKEVS